MTTLILSEDNNFGTYRGFTRYRQLDGSYVATMEYTWPIPHFAMIGPYSEIRLLDNAANRYLEVPGLDKSNPAEAVSA